MKRIRIGDIAYWLFTSAACKLLLALIAGAATGALGHTSLQAQPSLKVFGLVAALLFASTSAPLGWVFSTQYYEKRPIEVADALRFLGWLVLLAVTLICELFVLRSISRETMLTGIGYSIIIVLANGLAGISMKASSILKIRIVIPGVIAAAAVVATALPAAAVVILALANVKMANGDIGAIVNIVLLVGAVILALIPTHTFLTKRSK